MTSYNTEQYYKCDKCNYHTINEKYMKNHERKHKFNKHCDLCNLTFAAPTLAEKHYNTKKHKDMENNE